MSHSSNWGGPRNGAGRPPLFDEPVKRTTISVPEEVIAWLREVGDGNQSHGIRKLWRKHRDNDPRDL